jgi:hypothetical protein
MDTINPAPNDGIDASRPETEAERQCRLAWEAEGLARALRSLPAITRPRQR